MANIELLSPAKNLDFGIEAINCGADAVYIAAENFGARKNAGNSIADIKKLIDYAHKFYAKVYVVINTILFDDELEIVQNLINTVYEIGADAIIIQDVGILEMNLPPIQIFSSTQMHNCTVEKIKFYESIGIKRAILARELSLSEIKNIRNNTNIELETFIHGALCVSYSGQCYISQHLTNRSGNRGECAQICRTPFNLVDDKEKIILKNKHLLSIRDLNLSKHIEELIHAGVNSFKIEGRLKDLAYVKNITLHYRRLIDSIIYNNSKCCKASSGKTYFSFIPEPDKTFNRLFTDYNIENKKQKLANFHSPKSLGEEIGFVINSIEDYYLIDTKEKINNADGICYIHNEELKGFKVNKAIGNKIYPDKFKVILGNTVLFRNYNHEFLKTINSKTSKRIISVDIDITETTDGLNFLFTDEDDNQINYELISEKAISKNANLALENINNQLKKTGNTIFEVKSINYKASPIFFIPIKELNQIRRIALELLVKKRVSYYFTTKSDILKNDIPFPEKNIDYTYNVTNKLAINFYKRHKANVKQMSVEKTGNYENVKLMTTKYCLKYEIGICETYQNPKEKISNLFICNFNNIFILEFNCKECLMYVYK